MLYYRPSVYKFFLSVLTALFLLPSFASAQMFSIDDSDDFQTVPDIGVYAGIESMDFQYQGTDEEAAGAGSYAFEGTLIRFIIEGRGVSLSIGTGGNFSGLEDVSYFDAGIKFGYALSLYRSSEVNFQIPFQLHSGFTRASNENVLIPAAPEFQQGTLEFGTGADFNAKLSRQVRIGLNLIPSYGFTFSTQERDAGGSIYGVEGEGRVYFDRLFDSIGISLGYNYNFKEYDIEGDFLDYKATAHSFLIGITF